MKFICFSDNFQPH